MHCGDGKGEVGGLILEVGWIYWSIDEWTISPHWSGNRDEQTMGCENVVYSAKAADMSRKSMMVERVFASLLSTDEETIGRICRASMIISLSTDWCSNCRDARCNGSQQQEFLMASDSINRNREREEELEKWGCRYGGASKMVDCGCGRRWRNQAYTWPGHVAEIVPLLSPPTELLKEDCKAGRMCKVIYELDTSCWVCRRIMTS